jgi:hypothetical protein
MLPGRYAVAVAVGVAVVVIDDISHKQKEAGYEDFKHCISTNPKPEPPLPGRENPRQRNQS